MRPLLVLPGITSSNNLNLTAHNLTQPRNVPELLAFGLVYGVARLADSVTPRQIYIPEYHYSSANVFKQLQARQNEFAHPGALTFDIHLPTGSKLTLTQHPATETADQQVVISAGTTAHATLVGLSIETIFQTLRDQVTQLVNVATLAAQAESLNETQRTVFDDTEFMLTVISKNINVSDLIRLGNDTLLALALKPEIFNRITIEQASRLGAAQARAIWDSQTRNLDSLVESEHLAVTTLLEMTPEQITLIDSDIGCALCDAIRWGYLSVPEVLTITPAIAEKLASHRSTSGGSLTQFKTIINQAQTGALATLNSD